MIYVDVICTSPRTGVFISNCTRVLTFENLCQGLSLEHCANMRASAGYENKLFLETKVSACVCVCVCVCACVYTEIGVGGTGLPNYLQMTRARTHSSVHQLSVASESLWKWGLES